MEKRNTIKNYKLLLITNAQKRKADLSNAWFSITTTVLNELLLMSSANGAVVRVAGR